MRKIEANEEGKFFCDDCGSELNIPDHIAQVPIPEGFENDRTELTMSAIFCPNSKCGKSYFYDKSKNILRE